MNHSQKRLTDPQNAFVYAVYMMISSSFEQAFCDSFITEEWLQLQYMQERSDLQAVMTDICTAYAGSYLPELLPDYIWEEKVCILIDRDYDRVRSVSFEGLDFTLNLRASYRNRDQAVIACQLDNRDTVTGYITRIHTLGDGMTVFETKETGDFFC